jgi:hypothetical protein
MVVRASARGLEDVDRLLGQRDRARLIPRRRVRLREIKPRRRTVLEIDRFGVADRRGGGECVGSIRRRRASRGGVPA